MVEKLKLALQDGGSFDGEILNYRKDGTTFWNALLISPVRDERGAMTGFLGIQRDISKRKQAELALRESEDRFRRLIEHAPEAIQILDVATGRFVQVNPASEHLFKLSADELCRVGPREMSPPVQPDGRPSGEAARDFVSRAMAGETPVFEWTHRDSEGRDIPCEVRLLRLELGGRVAVRGSVTDITERKRLEQEREQYLKFFQLSTEPMSIADPFGCIKQVNPAALKLTGYSESELVGHPFMDFILPEDRARTAEEMKLQVEVRPSMQFENRYVCKDGTVILLSWTAIYDKSDGVTYATARNITKLRQAEVALRESEFRWKFAIEGSGDGLWDWDLQTNTVFFSKRWKEMLGYAEDEIGSGLDEWESRVHPEDLSRALADVRAHHDGTTPHYVNEHRMRCKDGTWKWILDRGLVVSRDAAGKPLRMIGTHSDITARRQAEIEREQLDRKVQETQKLESLGVLAGGIAHDFNNLLTAILGNASIAQVELPPGSSVHDCLEHITEASLRAADLCKQMLAYSGRGRFVVQKLDLGELVEGTAQMLQISISKKAVLRYRLEKGLPPVEVDATQMRQVIMNLVINASEAIGDRSGVISISTGLTRVDRHYLHGTLMDPDLPEGDYVFLEVSDSGCGMDAETQARIFDPFFTTKFTGRGLGLAAVLGIVRGHKGAMKVYSEVGRGTTFKLLFPIATGGPEVSKAPPAAVAQWHGEGSVLVVDDEETMRSTVARMMRIMGLEPVLAVDGREAIEIFREDPARFAFVLLDLTMPHMDGEQTFAELRRLLPDVRVVLMSGFNAQEALVRFSGKGLANFLQKPFTIESLREVVRGVLG
jgi:PAS domain S-box-containing protein